MGMRFGVLAVKCRWDAFVRELSPMAGKLRELGRLASLDGFDLEPREDGFVLAAGSNGGASYLLDASMTLTTHAYDRLAGLSRALGCLLAACCAEPTSGTYSLFVAQNGEPRRLHFNCVSVLSRPFDLGEPFPSEKETPLADVDGAGFFRVFESLGFDFPGWQAKGEKRSYLYSLEALAMPVDRTGPIDSQFDRHHELYSVPEDRRRNPVVKTRVLPDGSVGFDIVAAPPSGSGFMAKLRRRFGRVDRPD